MLGILRAEFFRAAILHFNAGASQKAKLDALMLPRIKGVSRPTPPTFPASAIDDNCRDFSASENPPQRQDFSSSLGIVQTSYIIMRYVSVDYCDAMLLRCLKVKVLFSRVSPTYTRDN